jgi:hypothetical protein
MARIGGGEHLKSPFLVNPTMGLDLILQGACQMNLLAIKQRRRGKAGLPEPKEVGNFSNSPLTTDHSLGSSHARKPGRVSEARTSKLAWRFVGSARTAAARDLHVVFR